mmetsp:Transcript_27773/g.24576  ORF Transcript_27773/g.24576 Transcript_27773/m.24576 type:complete len:166 (+) Transcript_27773:20-517(+)|eukprot:CAMPEP_0201589638 /NCGR_PEP_ID=MMETSP0190_2-20130828/169085_1 /ASSEMBLY_ACC=CAM_ASM_000263 /TAXON_ID=37353 /ORGANISM="Rosalina sp." /LENGTH=165 /DNA_ID=CAMNT_0048044231 /DNA_START=20 /DNA_END=517 /DNA_ORIENTATION=+
MWSKTAIQRANRLSHTLSPQSSSIVYESRRNIGIRDSLRGKNSFPHLIRFPKDYWPTPPGYEHVQEKIKFQQKLTDDELNVVQIHWGLDGMGLVVFGVVIIVGSCMLALYPARLRKERLDNQIMANWVSENAEYLEGSAVEDLIHKYARDDDISTSDESDNNDNL